jgi:PIN domain nuclease of toxin-antitoxin system
MPKAKHLLLDTHIWVWLLNGEVKVQKSAVFSEIIAASQNNTLHLSAISIWEVAMLEAKGRITFTTDITSWITNAISAPGLAITGLRPDISIDSTHLPGNYHGDPADRIIIATARHLKCPLITADEKILSYANEGFVDALPL